MTDFTKSAFSHEEANEKFKLIVGLQSPGELADDFTAIYGTVALVSALMLSMLEIGRVQDVASDNM